MHSVTLTKDQIQLADSQAEKIKNSKIYTSYWDEKNIALGLDRKSTRLNSSHVSESRMPSSA